MARLGPWDYFIQERGEVGREIHFGASPGHRIRIIGWAQILADRYEIGEYRVMRTRRRNYDQGGDLDELRDGLWIRIADWE
jgi:hypothetical protein